LINIQKENHQVYISLTEKGKKKAGWLQIDNLKIFRPKKWDQKWRLIMFDITQLKKTHRDAFRGKLKELGFQPFQKSVWIHPFDCEAEIDLLRKFFGLFSPPPTACCTINAMASVVRHSDKDFYCS